MRGALAEESNRLLSLFAVLLTICTSRRFFSRHFSSSQRKLSENTFMRRCTRTATAVLSHAPVCWYTCKPAIMHTRAFKMVRGVETVARGNVTGWWQLAGKDCQTLCSYVTHTHTHYMMNPILPVVNYTVSVVCGRWSVKTQVWEKKRTCINRCYLP